MSDKKNDPGTGRYWNRRNNPPKVVRRLGTFDSRKPGQSPKEMKKLLEKADDTLKSTKMKPEFQGSPESENMKFIREHNASAKKIIQTRESNYRSFGEPQYGSPEYDMDAHDEARREDRRDRASEKRLTRRANKVKDTVSINRTKSNMKKPKTVKLPGSNKLGGQDSSFHDLKYYGKTGRELSKFQHSSSGLGEYLDPDQVDHQNNIRRRRHRQQLGGFTTKGKQRILEGGSPKGSITARAGAGLGWLKRKYLSYGASQWRKSKTH